MDQEYHPLGGEQTGDDKRTHIPPAVIWSIIAFVVGILFQAGTSWGSKSSEVQTLSLQVIELKSQIDKLRDEYTQSHEQFSGDIRGLNQHLTYDDSRLDRCESKRGY